MIHSSSDATERKQWTSAIERVAQALRLGKNIEQTVSQAIKNLSSETRLYALREALLVDARHAIREDTLRIEGQSSLTVASISHLPVNQSRAEETQYPVINALGEAKTDTRGNAIRGYAHGGRTIEAIRRGAWGKGCKCERCQTAGEFLVALEEIELKRQKDLLAGVEGIIDDYTHTLKIEWTAELLDSSFSLRDGTIVTWGNATITEHQERIEIFATNVTANIEGAAMHTAAISAIKKAHVKTLKEVQRRAA